jgi:hypothetical protein
VLLSAEITISFQNIINVPVFEKETSIVYFEIKGEDKAGVRGHFHITYRWVPWETILVIL